MTTTSFAFRVGVSFGDCDPAGIVFYPRYFAWFDATYHAFLTHLDLPHAKLCARLGCLGSGVIESGADFRSPATNGDMLDVVLSVDEWHEHSFRLLYDVRLGDRPVVHGFEVRGLFMRRGDRLEAGPVAPLKALLEERGTDG